MTGPRVSSFPPIAPPHARVLILGSMPGRRSLDENRYYAHPQNAFWRIVADFTGVAHDAPYPERIAGLERRGIAVWDVLQSCIREGSLDSSIDESSIEINDFPGLFTRCPDIASVFFNGAKAEQSFRRRVLPTLESRHAAMHYERLPSTSPAHAGMRLDAKREAWTVVREHLDAT